MVGAWGDMDGVDGFVGEGRPGAFGRENGFLATNWRC
ncbi:MAG: hypothetical protein ACI8PT_004043 [Gammaproteobacteria bacterium]|jgi:hypothetical protein